MNGFFKRNYFKKIKKLSEGFSTKKNVNCELFHNHDIVHAFQKIYVECYPRLSHNLFKVFLTYILNLFYV